VNIAAGARLITGTDDVTGEGIPSSLVSDHLRSYYRSFVHCKRHSFISTNVVVLPGVTIGEGAVVGAGSVVTNDLEPWGIYIGSPALRTKDRPREKILELEKRAYAEHGVARSDVSSFERLIRDLNRTVR
jgi:galactoside O-acetyltransferase